jgi:hypothetical protein
MGTHSSGHFHVCGVDKPVCSCGRRWEYKRTYVNKDGSTTTTYTSKLVRNRYHATYGVPKIPFIEI